MAICWRCGIEFDDSDFLKGSPCVDCQAEEAGVEFRKLNVVAEAEKVRRDALVKEAWEQRLPDNAIGSNLGLSERQVRQSRDRQGLAGHKFGGTELWKDPDEVRRIQSESSKAYWRDPERKPQKKRVIDRSGTLAAKGDNHGWK